MINYGITRIYSSDPSDFAKDHLFYAELAGEYTNINDYRIERDFYNSLLVMHIDEGELTVEYEGNTLVVAAKEFVFIDCRKPHCYYSKNNISLRWVHLQGNSVFAYSEILTKRFGTPIVIKSSSVIIQEFKILMGNLRGNNTFEHTLSAEIHMFLATISEKISTQTRSTEQALSMAESYLRQNFNKQISIVDVANEVEMSLFYFTRQFQKQFGISPYEYLIMQRISNAKKLLLNSNLSTQKIAEVCGYNNSSTFIAAFKSRLGSTPSQFRKAVKEHLGL